MSLPCLLGEKKYTHALLDRAVCAFASDSKLCIFCEFLVHVYNDLCSLVESKCNIVFSLMLDVWVAILNTEGHNI